MRCALKKAQLSLKSLNRSLVQRCINHELYFRIHLLWELRRKARNPRIDKPLLEMIARQYPCECLLQRVEAENRKLNREESASARDLDALVSHNELLDESNRQQLLDLYGGISAAKYTFMECVNDRFTTSEFDEHSVNLLRTNRRLHKELTSTAIDSEQVVIKPALPRPIHEHLLETQERVDRQVAISVEVRTRTASRALTSGTKANCMDSMISSIRAHISKCVEDEMPGPGGRCVTPEDRKLERALLLEKADKLNRRETCDTNTLAREYEEFDEQYRRLMDDKRTTQTEISQIKSSRRMSSLAKVGITKQEEMAAVSTKLREFNEIIRKNQDSLTRILQQNAAMKRRIDQRETIEKSRIFAITSFA